MDAERPPGLLTPCDLAQAVAAPVGLTGPFVRQAPSECSRCERLADVLVPAVQMLMARVAALESRVQTVRTPPAATDAICIRCGGTFPRRSARKQWCDACRRAWKIEYSTARNARIRNELAEARAQLGLKIRPYRKPWESRKELAS